MMKFWINYLTCIESMLKVSLLYSISNKKRNQEENRHTMDKEQNAWEF